MLAQLLTIVVWTALEYLLLRVWHEAAPDSFGKFLTKLFPPASP